MESVRHSRMKWFVIGGVAAAALGIYVAFFGAFGYSSVCSRCGAVRQTTEWQIPRTSIPILSRSSVRQTPVSLSMTTNRIAPPHGHQWVFAQGGGNGVRCALGRARLVRSTVESSQVAQLLTALERYGERGFRDKVLTNLFDDSTTLHGRRGRKIWGRRKRPSGCSVKEDRGAQFRSERQSALNGALV